MPYWKVRLNNDDFERSYLVEADGENAAFGEAMTLNTASDEPVEAPFDIRCEPATPLSPGDLMVSDGITREIVDVRPTGYGWKYPDHGDTLPNGNENYWWSENSTDPFFETWRLAEPATT